MGRTDDNDTTWRVSLVWGNSLLADRCFADDAIVTVGERPRDAFVVPGRWPQRSNHLP